MSKKCKERAEKPRSGRPTDKGSKENKQAIKKNRQSTGLLNRNEGAHDFREDPTLHRSGGGGGCGKYEGYVASFRPLGKGGHSVALNFSRDEICRN